MRFDSQLSRTNCQTFSTGFNSGERGGSSTRVMQHKGDVVRHLQLGRDVPARLVEHEHGMRAGRDRLTDLRQLRGHGLGVAIGQDETGALALLGANGTEDVGPGGALVVRG